MGDKFYAEVFLLGSERPLDYNQNLKEATEYFILAENPPLPLPVTFQVYSFPKNTSGKVTIHLPATIKDLLKQWSDRHEEDATKGIVYDNEGDGLPLPLNKLLEKNKSYGIVYDIAV